MTICLVSSAFISKPISLKATKASLSFLTVLTLHPVKAKVMENVYEMFCGPRVLYGVEVWVVRREWEIIDKIRGRSLKEFIRSPRNTANRTAEWEFGRILTQARCLVV
jgi:hypothetical protein